ncbi:MAG: glycosyltransferase family 2 protein [Muribaculaceae bacterium]|nr:glycosyltransferase family 2 protein [Muribaculaceae bacterium]
MKKVSVLIPLYNECQSLPQLFDRLTALMDSHPEYLWEVLLVNDGSTDASLALLIRKHGEDNRFRYVDLSRNFGKEVAMLAGMDHVTGDCTVIMDADLQHPPELIPDMLHEWEQGYDDVYGQRLSRGSEPWLRRKLTAIYYRLLQESSTTPVLPNTGDFRLLDRSCIKALRTLRESQRYTKGLFCYIGFRKKAIPFDQQDRKAGKSKQNYMRLFSLAIEGITSNTTLPLRIATVAGMVISLLALLYMVFIVVKTVAWGEPVQGFPTLMVAILLLGGVQLLAIGIIGEYLARVFRETKNRPTYFIREIDGRRPE